ncbi:hypothetical protein ASF17_09790 [Frigoribacterium sp. Leaf263]|uniref:hypothetical protein n=1 Tax=Frigoribacterium sp. Leaf263 TaxID=1736313 RepID=UPI0006F5E208|nr:hypothetical protein [Frigoribacterium sp. Leaf263]KQO81472.1 hypothetical protein ASF17_09790 [Frigoribacterium sp. Leaf263]
MITRRIGTIGATGLALVLLAGCAGQTTPAEPVSSTTDTASTSSSPSPSDTATTESPAAATPVTIPTDCTQIVDEAAYTKNFGDIPLNPVEFGYSGTASGAKTPSDASDGASAIETIRAANELSCYWRDPRSDASGIGVDMARLDPSITGPLLEGFAAEGYDCTTTDGGRLCQLVTPDPQYPVDRTQTYFVRDDIVVTVDQTNVPTDDLIGSIATRLWG